MPEPANSALDDARKRARRRLVGAIVLALGAAVVVPIFLESDPKPLGPDVQVQIPAIDDAKFQNRLTPPGKSPDKATTEKAPADKPSGASPAMPKSSGVIADSAPAKAAPDASVAKPDVETPVPATKSPADVPAVAQAPAGPSQPAPPPTPPAPAKPAAASGEASSKAVTKEPAKETKKETAQKDAAKQADAKKAAPKKAPEPEPATNLGVATVNTAPPAAKSAGEFVVQVGAFADKTVATELAAKAGEQGYPVFLEPITTKSGPIQRVRVGPFATRAAADQAAARLAAAGLTAVARPR